MSHNPLALGSLPFPMTPSERGPEAESLESSVMDLRKEGSFQKVALRIVEEFLDDGHLETFSKLNSVKEKFGFVWNNEFLQKEMDWPNIETSKSLDAALSAKETGNKKYKKRHLEDALQSYTDCLILTPRDCPGGETLPALAAGNRSAVLVQLGRYKEAVKDIEYAIDQGYPHDAVYKLNERAARCLMKLGDLSGAREQLEKAEKGMVTAKIEQEKIDEFLGVARKELSVQEENAGTNGQTNDEKEAPGSRSSDGSDEIYVGKSVVIRRDPVIGRHGEAEKEIRVGEDLIIEIPFASVLSTKCFKTHCYHCVNHITVPYPCPGCTAVLFCDPKCAINSWESYHKYECQFYIPNLAKSGAGAIGHMGLKLALVAGAQAVTSESDYDEINHEKPMTGINAIRRLVSNRGTCAPEELVQYCILAAFVVKMLTKNEDWSHGLEIDWTVVGTEVLENLLRIKCNGIEITETTLNGNFSTKDVNAIALAMFPTVSLLNHSCDPTCELIFHGNSCTVRAIRDMKPGDEICIDYGYVYYLRDKNERQMALGSQYRFFCTCTPCDKNWPTKANLPQKHSYLLCPKCGATVRLSPLNIAQCACSACQHEINCSKTLALLKNSSDKADAAISSRDYPHAVRVMEGHVRLLYRLVPSPNRAYCEALWKLRQLYQAENSFK